ncbi:hypothetical protein V6N11_025568 [Hibiscus sabdariffa]
MGTDSSSQTKPMPLSTEEEDPSTQSTALLSFNTDSSLESEVQESFSKPRTIIFIALILLICVALSATTTATATATARNFSRPLNKLEKPVVLLVSSDGFRFGYQFKLCGL